MPATDRPHFRDALERRTILLDAAMGTRLLALGLAATARAASVPPNFVVENAVPASTFTGPVSVTFLPDGRFIVSEQRGIAYMVVNGVKRSTPLWSATAEILSDGEHITGLFG